MSEPIQPVRYLRAPVSTEEIRAAASQLAREVRSLRHHSRTHTAPLRCAVDQVARSLQRTLDGLAVIAGERSPIGAT